MELTFGEICNYFLYALSGFFFGIFASRYSIISALKILEMLQVVFLATAFFIFPVLFISKTQVGGFFYYAVLVYFFNKGYRLYISNKKP